MKETILDDSTDKYGHNESIINETYNGEERYDPLISHRT